MPWRDWQFLVVTAFALGAVVVLVRTILPRKRRPKGTRVELTREGEKTARGRR